MIRLTTLLLLILVTSAFSAEPLRVFIRSGPKSHGPGAHDYPQFLKDWVPMLNERGAKASGKNGFPTKEELDATDVLILHAQEAGNIAVGEERKDLLDFLKRGGGLVVIHAGAVSRDPQWFKSIAGGSWNHQTPTKWLEAPMSLYFTDRENPITRDIANFDIDDEIYYDMDILPEVKVLAAAYTPKALDTGGKGNKEAQQRAAEAVAKGKAVNIYDIQPQMWTYEGVVTEDGAKPAPAPPAVGGNSFRSFVCIPGHHYKNFSHNGLRTALLRGIAWAGKREGQFIPDGHTRSSFERVARGVADKESADRIITISRQNCDLLCKPGELGDALRYVEGGPPRPQDVPKHLEVHPEFDISLVASEPLINKPMNIDWDEKGRLWVVETPEYPNGLRQANVDAWKDSGTPKPGQYQRQPLDRVSILTDSDGDGIMDMKQVFADKIELATSSVFYKNGIIVCAAPDIWYFQDTNGDDKADKRTKLYTNLGNRDTHAVINNMRWGLDGWVYATHGYSSSENVTSGDGAKGFGAIGAGVVRFKPDGSAFEQYASRGGNTWGLNITWDGQVFYTQPTSGNHFIHVVLPEYVLAKGKLPGVVGTNGMLPREPVYSVLHAEQQAYVQIDQVGSYTAAAGCAIYEGGAWPEKWNYGYFTTEPTVNIVSHFMVEKDGVTYKAHREPGREQTEFIRSTNLWFRPIEVRVGPDGALYIVDFCNQAVIHNDTRGPVHGPANAAVRPDRDHYYGRIWKVQHKDAKKLEVVKLDKSDAKALEQVVRNVSANAPTRHLAWRLLQEGNANPLGTFPRHTMGSGALKQFELRRNDPEAALAYFINYDDPWMGSAMVAALSEDPVEAIRTAFGKLTDIDQSKYPAKLVSFVEAMVPIALQKNAQHSTTKLLAICASADPKLSMVAAAVLRELSQQSNISLSAMAALKEPLQKLLANPATAALALPLATKWDTEGELADIVNAQVASLTARLDDKSAPSADRINAAKTLVSLGAPHRAVGVKPLGDQNASPELQTAIIHALDESGDSAPIVAVYDRLKPALQQLAFDAILKRPESTLTLLTLIEQGKLKTENLGPSNVARLRTHPNKQVATRANRMLEKLSPSIAAKNELIAKLVPEVEKPGDAAKGKMFFAACAVCHKFGDTGQQVGPPLDGMGAHGPAELLVHIVDPNREVDPSFWAHNIITKKGDAFVGVITSENASTVTLATQLGVKEVAKTDIATRENTRRSLMPEGLEALGAETLRDILAYMCGDALKQFRIVDLRPAYTADNREGVFASPGPKGGVVRLAKYGNVSISGIPFFIQDAAKSATGSNIIVLKGGPEKSQSWTYPQRVEVAVNAEAKKLHLLSGIAGWGFPAVKDHVPAMKATVTYASGESEVFVLTNGKEFADYIRPVEVPGSQIVKEPISDDQQVRLLTLTLTKKGPIKTLALESFANRVAPVVIAVTADVEGKMGAKLGSNANTSAAIAKGKRVSIVKGPDGSAKVEVEVATPKEGGKGDGPLAPATPVSWEPGKTKVLIIGGGSSHNFAKFFGESDSATLKGAGFTTHYTEDRDQAAQELANADVAIVSVNRKFFDTQAYRKALMDFAAAGKGIIMLHPGTWYGFAEWPELNAQIVGGGARGHDKLGPFSVSVVAKDHPIMKGVPASFDVFDELYYVNAEPEKIPPGTASIDVLAQTSPSQKFGKPHPSVWTTKHDKARIVGIALGHDERVHDLDAYKKILSNAVKWAAERK